MTAAFVPHVYEHDGAVYADSRQVAEAFGKRHADVLRTIEKTFEINADAKLRWLKPSGYVRQHVAAHGGRRMDHRCDRQEARSRHPPPRTERPRAMTRRLRDTLRAAAGILLVAIAVIISAAAGLAADDREGER